ncbi:hypothetical protein SETIT_4G284600v2 [Setaria italica]|uniref:GDSL esterase/lipase n=3 Tax=Setaria italica TaxID=4555 RepID=A0A368QZ82_SETIT|nr:hypothetical protein SETIT_4G284600v2 [Setaria italica]
MIMGSNTLMAMEGFVVCLVISMEVLGAAAAAVLQPPPPMYVFGDSYLDVGNNNYLSGPNVPRANRPYYGIDFPGFPTGRFSNGYNTADYIAKKIGLAAGSPPPYLSVAWSSSLVVSTALTIGMSYASGGAGILDSTNAGDNIPLSKQVQYFNATRSKMVAAVGSGAVDTLLSRSVVLIGAGGNDLSVFANAQQQSDVAAFYGSLMSNYSAAITDLYTLGARKFAITNVALAGCLPAARVLDAAGSCSDYRNYLADRFDDALRSLLADLAARLPGFLYSLADSFALMVDTFYDPQASSGFTDVASACCGGGRLGAEAECSLNSTICANRDQHYFWDNVHITQQAAKQRAQAFYDGPAKYTTPINFKQLVQKTAA